MTKVIQKFLPEKIEIFKNLIGKIEIFIKFAWKNRNL